MTRIEELVVIHAPAAAARRVLLSVEAMRSWSAPDVTVVPPPRAVDLVVGDRFGLELVGGMRFEYLVEAASDREVVFTYEGPWRGTERWSFVPDGTDTVVRRMYTVEGGSPAATLLWATVGRAAAAVHLRYELARFRDAVERAPGPRGEIPALAVSRVDASAPPVEPAPRGGETKAPPFPVDDG